MTERHDPHAILDSEIRTPAWLEVLDYDDEPEPVADPDGLPVETKIALACLIGGGLIAALGLVAKVVG